MNFNNKFFVYYSTKFIINDLKQFLDENDKSKKLTWLTIALYHSYQLKLYMELKNITFYDREKKVNVSLNHHAYDIIDILLKYVQGENANNDVENLINYFSDFMAKRKNRKLFMRMH